MAAIRRQPLTTGQAGEWLVWTHLALQPGGDLHVFLPGLDRGIDGFIHRRSTDAHLAVTTVCGRRIAFELTAPELSNPNIQVVVVHLGPRTASLAPRSRRWRPR